MPRKTTDGQDDHCPADRSFNEAAARCRGKPELEPRDVHGAVAASMRPRPDAAENRATARGGRRSTVVTTLQ